MKPRRHPALPPENSLPWVVTAAAVWVAAVMVTALTGPSPLQPAYLSAEAVLLTDPLEGRYGHRAIARTDDGDVLLEMDEIQGLLRGSHVRFDGQVRGEPGRMGAYRYRGRVEVMEIQATGATSPIHVQIGQAVRDRTVERLEPLQGGRALLAGFLIGDISGLSRTEAESMRLAGLSHFVAVSGSNVALFVGLLVFAAGPLAMGPKRRALVGLAGLPVYAAATRFEPSVMRASVMAALALGGRVVGIVFEAWQLLSLAVVILVVLQPSLTGTAGFQLSVVATAGVLVGARWPIHGGKVGRALAVTIGAQAAVAPLILLHFGAVPLLSPVANLIAAPVVAASTVIGAVGVAGPDILISVAAGLAEVVLALARGAETWPQLEAIHVLVLMTVIGLGALWPGMRPALATGGLILVAVSVLSLGRPAPDSSVIVLDVGQGDSILIHGGGGSFALVDGGPDEVVLMKRLRAYGVGHLDLVVLTHVHADHATGLIGLPGRVSIGEVWARNAPHETSASAALMSSLDESGIPIVEPQRGLVRQLGDLQIVVEAPVRRYASPNDQSIVITVRGPSREMLLAGDIEVIAQGELDHLRADVLKVPHQGAATSDPDWLRGVGADLAVISVGPNQFGHPAEWVIEVLEGSGAQVLRTDHEGDIVVPLG